MLSTPDVDDRTTHVHWLQASSLFVDLRVPFDRQAGDPGSLARQQGFAGRLSVASDVLTWHRWLDFQPPGAPDVGRITFREGLMIEHGVLADYYEEWERIATWPADGIALTLESELDHHGKGARRAGILLAGSGHFAFALQRPVSLPPARDLAELLNGPSCTRHQRHELLDCAIEFGRCLAPDAWRVQRSTVPSREGLDFHSLYGVWRKDGPAHYAQVQPEGVLRRWRMLEGPVDFEFPASLR